MLEPVLDHNRAEFARLHRLRRKTLVPGIAGLAVIAVGVVKFGDGSWFLWAWAFVFGGFMCANGILEARKTLVFRRDLREQRVNRTSHDN
jgi:uncharacterized membrane protein HdeD (DUF308 family)